MMMKVDRRELHLSVPLSSLWSTVWRLLRLCACRWCLELPNTSDLPRRKPLAMVTSPASLSARPFVLIDSSMFRTYIKTVLIGGCRTSLHACLGFPFYILYKVHWTCENDGMCGQTATSQGNPADSTCDCVHFHFQAGGWDLMGCTVSVDGSRDPPSVVFGDWAVSVRLYSTTRL